jgi:hypothetical protein
MSAETMRDAASDPIQMLWIGELSKLERMALASFVANGHTVHLYAYDDLAGVPDGVQVIDAREILPEERIFRYGPEAGAGEGSLANFANLFRYKLLYERGGWWVDADVVCLRPFDFDAPYVFAYQDETSINCAVMRLPQGSAIAQSLYEEATSRGTNTKWGEIGPDLFSSKVQEFGLSEYALTPKTFFPIYHKFALLLYIADNKEGSLEQSLKDSHAVHFWNEILRRTGQDKNGDFPPTSIYERLKARFGV